jgi:hypothetical protein
MKTRLCATGALVLLLAACSGGVVNDNDPNPTPPAGSGGRGGASAGSGGRSGTGGSPGSGGGAAPGAGGAGGAAGSVAGGGSGGQGQNADARPPSGGSSGGDAGGGSSMPAGPPGPWARGVTVGLVEVTQGVFVKIGEGSTVLDPAMRNAPLIEGRPVFVRVHVVAGAGFTARRLRGVLNWDVGDGTSKALEDARMIAASSNAERLDTTFNFLLPAADVKPKAALAVSIYEMGTPEGADPATPPRFPATGTTDLAIKAGRMVLDVVAMPVTGPGGALMDTPERRKKLEDDLYDLYPVQKVNLRIRAPFMAAARITSSGAGFTALREARTADGAKPWEYYHLIVARQDTNFSFAGVASGAGAGANDGPRRVAITVTGTRTLDGNTNTFAHEIGHNHGRNHAPACGAAGADMMFPYMMGAIGVNGFSLSTGALKSKAMFKELMGYCRPRWISDFTWKQLEVRVRLMSAMAAGATETPPAMALAARSLQGFAGPGESPSFGLVAGRLVDDGAPAGGQARLTFTDGRQATVPVAVQLLSDDVTREIAVNLPDEEVQSAEIEVAGERWTVNVSNLPTP